MVVNLLAPNKLFKTGLQAGSSPECQDWALGPSTATSPTLCAAIRPQGPDATFSWSPTQGLGPTAQCCPPVPGLGPGAWHPPHLALHAGIRGSNQCAGPGASHGCGNLVAGERCQCSPAIRFPDPWGEGSQAGA